MEHNVFHCLIGKCIHSIFSPPPLSFSYVLFWGKHLRLHTGFIRSSSSTSESLFSTLTCNSRLLLSPRWDSHSTGAEEQHPWSSAPLAASISDRICSSRFIGSFVFWVVSDDIAPGLTVWIVTKTPSDTKPRTQYSLLLMSISMNELNKNQRKYLNKIWLINNTLTSISQLKPVACPFQQHTIIKI